MADDEVDHLRATETSSIPSQFERGGAREFHLETSERRSSESQGEGEAESEGLENGTLDFHNELKDKQVDEKTS